jgi:hypothetical protein
LAGRLILKNYPIHNSWHEDQARQNRFETNMKQRIAPYNSREDSGIFGKYVALPFIISSVEMSPADTVFKFRLNKFKSQDLYLV